MRLGLRSGALALSVLFAVLGLLSEANAQAVFNVDYVFPDPNTEIGDPDPAVWARSGNISPLPEPDRGALQISDRTDNVSLLLYERAWVANPSNAATFRGAVISDPVNDSFPAGTGHWANDDTTGFRLILDDSQRRLVLGLGRDPSTFARQVVVMGATGVAPIPFIWDNGFTNLYEIARLLTGTLRWPSRAATRMPPFPW